MAHGVQLDWHSCGIVLPNTIAHAIQATLLWEQHQHIWERIQWFLRLASKTAKADTVAVNTVDELITKPLDDEASMLLAIGDFNFPDLQQFTLVTNTEHQPPKAHDTTKQLPKQPHISLNELLNPASDIDEGDVSGYDEAEMGKSDGTSAFSHDDLLGSINAWGRDEGSSTHASEPQTESDGLSEEAPMYIDTDLNNEDHPGSNPATSEGDDMDIDSQTSAGDKLTSLKNYFQPSRTEKESTLSKVLRPMKHRRPKVESDSTDQSDSSGYRQRTKVAKGEGRSRSGKAARERQEKLSRGELELDPKNFEKW